MELPFKSREKPREKRKPRTRANELDGKNWLRNSISVWRDIKKSPEELRLKHPAMFPVQLVQRLIESFTNKDEKVVLDPFMGTGSTLVASQNLGKVGYGFEISKEYVNVAKNRTLQTDLFRDSESNQHIFNEDARDLKKYLNDDSVDICITSPPYWDILSQRRTADNRKTKDYEEKQGNLGAIKNYKSFLEELSKIFVLVYEVLNPGKYCIVVVMDIRKGNKFYPYHMDIIYFMEKIGLVVDDIIIWDRRNDYSNLRPIGYPSVFRINKIHEYLLIFQKPKEKRK